MLFTNHLNYRDTMDSADLVLQSLNSKTIEGSTKESQRSSRLKLGASVAEKEDKVMKLKEVESEYAESANEESYVKKNSHVQTKYISKLEKYIPQPKRAIESLIVKDQRMSAYIHENKSRFARSVMGPQSRL